MAGSSAFSLNGMDWKKIGTGLLVALAGAVLTYGTEWLSGADFGASTPIVVAAWSVLANIVRKWIVNNQEALPK